VLHQVLGVDVAGQIPLVILPIFPILLILVVLVVLLVVVGVVGSDGILVLVLVLVVGVAVAVGAFALARLGLLLPATLLLVLLNTTPHTPQQVSDTTYIPRDTSGGPTTHLVLLLATHRRQRRVQYVRVESPRPPRPPRAALCHTTIATV